MRARRKESEEEEEPNEDEKIEQDAKQQNEKNTDEMMTKEDEEDEKKENENEKDQEKMENNQEEEMEEMEENDDINDLNEQEYEDDHHMNPKDEEEEEEEDMIPEDMDIEDSGEEENINPDEMENEIPPEEEEDVEANENEEEEEEEINEEAESIDMQGIGEEEEKEENEEEEEEEAQNGENENPEIDDNQPEETAEKEETPEKKPNSMATEGIADEAGQDNVLGEESQQKSGQEEEKNEEMEEEDEEEMKETQRNGELKEGVGNTKEEEEEDEKKEDENEVNPYKNPEKTQKKWEEEYQRLQMIPQKEKEDENEEGLQQNDPNNKQQQEEQEQEKKKLGAEVKQEKSGQDVLAPSLQDVDFKPLTEESNRVEMEIEEEEEEEDEEKEPNEGLQYEKEMNDTMGENAPEFPEDEEALKEAEERKQREEAAAFASDLLDKVTKEGAGKSVDASETRGIFTKQDLELREAGEEEEAIKLPFIEEDSYLNMNVNELLVSAVQDPSVLSRSIGIWKECVASTTDLSNRLSEQLRLLMEPTKASKLTGDFKTGKRINMRKVIPFIASNYRKDKIWLRRSKPSQREYQIMLVIDNSESMKVNNAGEVSFKTLALIGNALSQLEVGQIGVMSFGDNVQYIHPLGTPFTAQSGASALAHFSFAQKTTSFEACLRALIAILAQSRLRLSGAAKRAVQIAFLVSDGRIQEGRERIARLLRDAEENNILVVLLIIDDTRRRWKEGMKRSESGGFDSEDEDLHGQEGTLVRELS